MSRMRNITARDMDTGQPTFRDTDRIKRWRDRKRLRTVETDDAVLKTKVGGFVCDLAVVSAIISALAAVLLRR